MEGREIVGLLTIFRHSNEAKLIGPSTCNPLEIKQCTLLICGICKELGDSLDIKQDSAKISQHLYPADNEADSADSYRAIVKKNTSSASAQINRTPKPNVSTERKQNFQQLQHAEIGKLHNVITQKFGQQQRRPNSQEAAYADGQSPGLQHQCAGTQCDALLHPNAGQQQHFPISFMAGQQQQITSSLLQQQYRNASSTGSKTTSQKIKAKRHEPSSAKRVKRQEPLQMILQEEDNQKLELNLRLDIYDEAEEDELAATSGDFSPKHKKDGKILDDAPNKDVVEQQVVPRVEGQHTANVPINVTGNACNIDKGPSKPSRDVPARLALARISNVVNPIVEAYDKLAIAAKILSDGTASKKDFDRDEAPVQIAKVNEEISEKMELIQ
ncbi:hypothetical protein A4A49_09136 [Nicotiana attenuata]|uniref:Uncharacterized protein n=1 Tax=Nicotiana attenuata TaxID=49451 RepID=A0A1J6IMF5_NICAT|nr:hypothetical protein A4A49_09136 [Nicotiana attenuata]